MKQIHRPVSVLCCFIGMTDILHLYYPQNQCKGQRSKIWTHCRSQTVSSLQKCSCRVKSTYILFSFFRKEWNSIPRSYYDDVWCLWRTWTARISTDLNNTAELVPVHWTCWMFANIDHSLLHWDSDTLNWLISAKCVKMTNLRSQE